MEGTRVEVDQLESVNVCFLSSCLELFWLRLAMAGSFNGGLHINDSEYKLYWIALFPTYKMVQ